VSLKEADDSYSASRLRIAMVVSPWYELPPTGSLSNPTAAALSALTRRLGGESGLLTWLDRFPGLPQLVATGVNDDSATRRRRHARPSGRAHWLL
jgi:hypothetical protein